MRLRIGLVLLGLTLGASGVRGHYHMLLPDAASVKKDQEVTFTFQFGHPFEHQLFDAAAPQSLVAVAPDGKRIDLIKKLTKVELKGDKGKKVTGYQFKYKPELRGDHVFVAMTNPVWMEEDKDYIQDTVKVILHVQAQKGWDIDTGRLELVPLTRPYGLTPGMVFQAEILDRTVMTLTHPIKPNPLTGAMAEVERYHSSPPAKLPPDEHITRTVKLDRLGKLIATLPDAGWWGLTVTSPHGGKHKDKDREAELRYRSTLWVFVDEAPK